MAFESAISATKTQYLHYTRELITQTLTSVNKTISDSMLLMWGKKCWKFLDFASIKSDSKAAAKKRVHSKVPKTPEQEVFEEFSDFYLFAHEFLCLASNSISRLEIVKDIFQPNFTLRKIECGLSKDQIKQYLYELTSEDRKGECRPNKLLETYLENDFFDHTPTRDEGYAMSNKEAGIEPSKKLMTIFPSNVKPLEYEIRKNTLGDSV